MGEKIKIKFVDTHEFAGLWDSQKNTIYISIHQSNEQIHETFWHEIVHCMQYLTGINQAVPRELLEVMAETQSRVIHKIVNL